MKLVKSFWVPDYDESLKDNISDEIRFARRPTYQFEAFRLAFPLIRNFRCALDVGAHVGLWTAMLAPCFEKIVAFEPVKRHAECFRVNASELEYSSLVELHQVALGAATKKVCMAIRHNQSLKACVKADDGKTAVTFEEVELAMLDAFAFEMPIDFIKIDCEGYEAHVVRGGEGTIRKHRPAIVVEQKVRYVHYGSGKLEAVRLLESWGAECVAEKQDDYFLVWPR